MDRDVDWPNALDGSRVRGREAVRQYWLSQFEVMEPHVEPCGFAEDEDGRIVVTVDQTVRDLDGNVVDARTLRHVYMLRAGRVARMDIDDATEA